MANSSRFIAASIIKSTCFDTLHRTFVHIKKALGLAVIRRVLAGEIAALNFDFPPIELRERGGAD
jgi:hypothetical protein